MDVRCDKCSTEYEFDENRIGANGVTVKCTACGYVFKVRKPGGGPTPNRPAPASVLGKGPQKGREWLVRKPDGQMIAFRELTTLQKWIVEGRIDRKDEISKNGETWKKLGNIMELEPFFSVFEKAQQLNELIDRGAMSGQRLEIRGSEVLQTMDPVGNIAWSEPPRPASQPLPAAGSAIANRRTIHADGLQAAHVATGSLPPEARPDSAPSAKLLTGDLSEPPVGHKVPAASETTTQPTKPANGPTDRPTEGPANGPTNGPTDSPAWASGPLTLSLSETPAARVDTGDLGRKAGVPNQRRTMTILLLIVVLGLAGGAGIARYGPEGNPLQVMAERYQLLQPREQSDGAEHIVDEARRTAELDSLTSLRQAAALLASAGHLRVNDPTIMAEHALVLMTEAGALRRWAGDLEVTARRSEATIAQWKQTQPNQGEGAGPAVPDPAALRNDATEKRKRASALLKRGFELAAAAYQRSPMTLEPVRALAYYYALQRDQSSFDREIDRAKTAIEKVGVTDAATLYIEAVAIAGAARSADPTALEQATKLLRQAITTRPSMVRARAFLARIQLLLGAKEEAKAQLDEVLKVSPDHEEARRLSAQLRAPPKPAAAASAHKAVPPPPEPGPSFVALMKQATRHRERDRARRALALYEEAAELNPTSAAPLAGMGWCYIDLSKPRAAVNAFRRALAVDSGIVEAYYGRAEAHRLLGQPEKAIKYYEKYLSQAPDEDGDRVAAERTLEKLRGSL